MRYQPRFCFEFVRLSIACFLAWGPQSFAQEVPEAPFASETSSKSTSEPNGEPLAESNDPFRSTPIPPPSHESFDAADPFAGSWSDVAKSLREPVDFENLPVDDLTKELAKLRLMRMDALQTHLVVLRSQLDSRAHDRLNLLEHYARTTIELAEAELEQAKSTAIKQASMRRAITALRDWEKACLDRNESSNSDASKSLAAVCLRLKWEERLVLELVQQKEKPKSKPVPQSPSESTVTPRSIVTPRTNVVQPASGYYYPPQPVYQYPRTYRSR